MKRIGAAVVSLGIWLTGCVAPPVDRDPYSGTYRFADPREKGYLVVSQVGENKWLVQMSISGGPPATHPLSQGSPMLVALPEVLAASFVNPTPIAQVACLASSGRYKVPLLCRVPINAEYQVAQAMSPGRRLKSATGYILFVITPAGAFAADLVRAP